MTPCELTACHSSRAAHSVEDVIRIAARETQRDLRAAVASISEWEASGRLRVRANHGRPVPGEAAFPRDESYPVSDFPAILLSANRSVRVRLSRFLREFHKRARAWVPSSQSRVFP